MEYLTRLWPLWACALCFVPFTSALSEQVLSTFIYTHHGERTPLIRPEYPSLTPLGARQAERAGANMRSRYVLPSNETSFVIRDISSYFLQNHEINILSSTDEWVTASAQAFMQGLFPPLTVGQNYTIMPGKSDLANSTNVVAPLGGYQYPNIQTASANDPRMIVVKGTDYCPKYSSAMGQYYSSPIYQSEAQQSQPFYDGLKEMFLNGIFPDEAVGYADAYYIWDYLSYAKVHNTTVDHRLSYVDYIKAQLYAGNWMRDMYANTTTDGKVDPQHIRAIAGRTLARSVLDMFAISIQQKGKDNKMNLVFGDYIPMMSFAAIAGLMTNQNGAFFYAPTPASSIIFELFTYEQETSTSTYPKTSDMFVRFYYNNGTADDFSPREYPLFGASPSQATMSYTEFVNAMSNIATSDVGDWCGACGSSSVFCKAISSDSQSGATSGHGLRPAIAGAIGAIAALAFIALLMALVMLLGRVRFYRQSKRTSQLGGFKGNEKLASDRDLTIPKGGAGVSVKEEPRGHERVGSWELKAPGNSQNIQSGIDTAALGAYSHGQDHDDITVDPWTIPVKAHDTF